MESPFAEQKIEHPAAADMLAGLAAMIEDHGIIAAGFFEGVGQDGQVGEKALAVNRPCQHGDAFAAWAKAGGEQRQGLVRMTGNVVQQVGKMALLLGAAYKGGRPNRVQRVIVPFQGRKPRHAGGSPSHFHVPPGNESVGVAFGDLHGSAVPLVGHKALQSAKAGTGEQSQLAIAEMAA